MRWLNYDLVSKDLVEYLDNKDGDMENLSSDGVYLVKLARINNDDSKIMYNYICYDTRFTEYLIIYLLLKFDFKDSLIFQEWGDFFCLISSDLDIDGLYKWVRNNFNLYEHFQLTRRVSEFDYELSNFDNVKKICHIKSYGDMSDIALYCLQDSYSKFMKMFINRVIQDNIRLSELGIYFAERHCLFVVKDLKNFIQSLKSNGLQVNQGIQSSRGMTNGLSAFLLTIDQDFRSNLYYNHYHHSCIKKRYALDRSKFSFRNVHIKLGRVRFYSTSKKNNKLNLYNKGLDIISNNQTIFTQLENFISNTPHNSNTQQDIENFLLKCKYLENDKKENSIIDYGLINKKLKDLLLSKSKDIDNIINNFKLENLNLSNVKGKQTKNPKKIALYYVNVICNTLDTTTIKGIMLGRLLKIITYYDKHNTSIGKNLLEILHDISDNLIREYIYHKYLESKTKNDTYSMWKNSNVEIINALQDQTLKTNIGGIFMDWLIEVDLVITKTITISYKEKISIAIPSEEVISAVGPNRTIMSLPLKIPMLVKPKIYGRKYKNDMYIEQLGGYLLNDIKTTDSLIIEKKDLKQQSFITEPNLVYSLVNNINSVGFKINLEVLEFIDKYGLEYDLILDTYKYKSILSKDKLTKVQQKNLESYMSNILLQENILGLARVFRNVAEFFIPVRLDYRGRMYCTSQYLNYQSSDLSKSLLLFSKPEKLYKNDITGIKYFKAYGANCFGNKLEKKSWNDRVSWVDKNIDNIINFNNGILINKADNKLLFIAFCIEFSKLVFSENSSQDYFETNLPIQLDATCNGYQHLSLLSNDLELANQLNLTKSNWSDAPKDFYTYMSTNVITYFKDKLKSTNLTKSSIESYTRLSNINIQRTIIKKALMTIPYGVSSLSMIKYIEEYFEPVSVTNILDKDKSNIWYQYIDDKTIQLKSKDLSILAISLKEILKAKFDKLNLLLKYLNDIAKICTSLNLYIPWTSSSGVLVRQSYLLQDEAKLQPFTYSKRSIVLRIPSKDGKYNNRKQIRSFMPNLVHSLDAASLALLTEYFFNNSNHINNMYAIHDCFAVTANNVDNIMELLKMVYRKIYYEDKYLIILDREVKHNIKVHYGEDCFNEETLEISVPDTPKLRFPNINVVLGKKLQANFLSSSYIIN